MMLEDAQRYNSLYQQLVKVAIACAPSTWQGGTLTIERDMSIICTLCNEEQSSHAQISAELQALCEQFAVCKTASGAGPTWSKAIIHFRLDDETVDFSAEGSFEYPDNPVVDADPEPQLDEAWWREQTKDFAWQQSPSLLVIEFMMDYKAWNDVAMQRNHSASQTTNLRQHIAASWQQLMEKFCQTSMTSFVAYVLFSQSLTTKRHYTGLFSYRDRDIGPKSQTLTQYS